MVEALVSAVADKLSSYLLQEPSLLYGVREEVDWLQRELRQMLCFLPDAVAKKKENCELVTKWVRDIRDITFDIEDAVETFMLEADILTRRGSFELLFTRCDPTAASERLLLMVASCFPIFGSIVSHRRTGREIIQSLETKIVEISERKEALGIISLDETGEAGSTSESKNLHGSNSVPHLYDGYDIVGFKEDQRKIVQLLNDGNNLRVIPVIGVRGHGKTTFAKNIYDDEEITDNFEVSYWISVSQNDTLPDFLVKIIREVGGKVQMRNLIVEVLKKKLCKILSSQGRYLIVMDDFCNKEVWDRIKTAFPDTGNGSRVIFTTQDVEFARSSDPVIAHHELSFLNPAESMELFLKKVYRGQNVEALPENLELLGRKLVEKCEGLPMSILVLGSLLSAIEKTHHHWLKVSNNLDREPTKNDTYSSILAICYAALPCHLKSCFLYTCSFPEDSEIPARRLMRLWIAEGFVLPRLGKTTTEMAEAFLEELAARSMVEVVSRRWDGTIKAIRIRIVLHHFCEVEARNCQFLHFVGSTAAESKPISFKVKRARRLALHTFEPESYIDDSSKRWRTPKLRTLILGSSTDELSLCGLRLLMVIDVEVADSSVQLPSEIASLIHLRYLRWRAFVDFQQIKTLCSLQTLHVQFGIHNVDNSIGNFKALQFLGNLNAGMWIESGLLKLTNLEKLGLEKIRDQDWKALIKSLGKLQRLASLTLSPCYSGKIPAQAISIFSSQHSLRRLKLFGTLSNKQLPQSSSFPPNLTKLALLFSELESDPMPTLKELPNLTSLELLEGAYVGKSIHCQAGGFPQLRYLKVHHLHNLKAWKLDNGAMPSLTHLCISYCNLKKLPKGLKHVTTLQHLILVPKDFERRILEEQGIIDDLVENKGAAAFEVGKEDEFALLQRREEELERTVQMVLAMKEAAPSSSESNTIH